MEATIYDVFGLYSPNLLSLVNRPQITTIYKNTSIDSNLDRPRYSGHFFIFRSILNVYCPTVSSILQCSLLTDNFIFRSPPPSLFDEFIDIAPTFTPYTCDYNTSERKNVIKILLLHTL